MTDSHERLEPRRSQPPRSLKDSSPGKLLELLGKIESTRSTFRSVLSNITKRQPKAHADLSDDLSQIDFKEELEKLQNSNEADTPTCPDIASKAIQQINEREIQPTKRLMGRQGQRSTRSPKSTPAIGTKKSIEHDLQERLPSPRQRPLVKLGRNMQNKNSETDVLRKSHLEIDLKNFKRNVNGTLVRIEPIGVEQQIQHKIQEAKPKANEAVILNITAGPAEPKHSPIRPCRLEAVDEDLVASYVRDHGFLEANASANLIYEYFCGLTQLLRLSFESPLIKKYKNCVYFGENPQGKLSYDGILYHYKSKLYFGLFKDGRKHGRGCEVNYKEGTVCRGEYQNGSKTGPFKVKASDYQYEGCIVDGLFQGVGTLTNSVSRYSGQFERGYKHGRGQQTFFLSGEKYVGFYDRGSFDGVGEITSKNYFYEGNFHNNLKHGQGYEKTVQDEYRGEFVEGKRHGKGSLYLANGDSYIGQFKDGQMYGRGEYSYVDGQSVHGYFINGRMISEKNMMAAAQPNNFSRTSRKFGGLSQNLSQIQENDDHFQNMDYAQTRKEWAEQAQMREFPRSHQQKFKTNSRVVFNPEKLIRLGKQNYTPEPSSRKFEDHRNLVPRRNSDFDRPAFEESRGIETQRYHSNERRSRPDMQSYAPSAKHSNNFMQMDYSLFDNSVDEGPPAFPLISGARLKSGHTEDPIAKRFA